MTSTFLPRRSVRAIPLALVGVLVLTACSGQPDVTRTSTSTPKPTTAAYPQPTVRLDRDQARVVAWLGLRMADGDLNPKQQSGFDSVSLCSSDGGFSPSDARSWLVQSEALQYSTPDAPVQGEVKGVARSVSAVMLLDPSPSAAKFMDERIQAWQKCKDQGDLKRTAIKVSAPGSSATMGQLEQADGDAITRYQAITAARVQNVVVLCSALGPSSKAVQTSATGCVADAARAVPVVADPAGSRGLLAAKALLARVTGKGWTTRPAHAPSSACPRSDRPTFAPARAAALWVERSVKQKGVTGAPEPVGVVDLELAPDAAAAKARATGIRKVMAACSGRFTKKYPTMSVPGEVLPVKTADLGDGGFILVWRLNWPGQKPEYLAEAVFSSGAAVVQASGFGGKSATDVQRDVAELARAVSRHAAQTG
ncbi:hypothetical protein [Knoellia koreensis]|uniref:PknH-like extracellular domain-containing protein n=1 Tax=Knoellia koreensis TaxID=2730921 RepID=A0A849HB36_9MICO|nr:hypothetical protein [Knoellia sp. DB2414S]NNM45145.1 hypothetical protein [Knoellia sp. DB2414S]